MYKEEPNEGAWAEHQNSTPEGPPNSVMDCLSETCEDKAFLGGRGAFLSVFATPAYFLMVGGVSPLF